jgi:hypothetical protein
MNGDIGSRRVAAGGRTARRPAPRAHHWRAFVCAALLLPWVLIAGIGTQAASAEEAVPAAAHLVDDEKQQRSGDVTPPSKPTKPEPETAAREPEAQPSPPSTGVPLSQAKTSKPELLAPPPEAQKPQSPAPKPGAEASRQGPKESTKDLTKDSAKDPIKDPAVPQLVLSADVAKKIGQKIWLNETGGKVEAITSWNANEEFASLGIGHFIWFPVGKWLPFEESFPSLLEFMRQRGVRLPTWLDKPQIPANPWTSRADFKKSFNSPEMRELRQFLLNTVAEQTQYMVARAQGAMGKILRITPDGAERAHILAQFSRIARASKDLYPPIDYINFKGEGTNTNEAAPDKETGQRQGWGFKQVLLKMNGSTDDPKAVLAEFADAAQAVLQQRVRNIPTNRVFEVGWLRRVDSYRRPIADAEPSAKPAQHGFLRLRAAR